MSSRTPVDYLHAAFRARIDFDSADARWHWKQFSATRDPFSFRALVEFYTPLAFIVAYQCKRRRPDFYTDTLDELVSDGCLGLIQALESARVQTVVAFGTFAKLRIRSTIIRQVKNRTWMGKRRLDRINLIARLRSELTAETGKLPTRQELTAKLGNYITNPQILIGDIDVPEQMPLNAEARSVVDRSQRTPEQEAISRDVMKVATKGLNRDERRMLKMVMEGHTVTAIAARLKVHPSAAARRVNGLLWELRSRTDLAACLGVEASTESPFRMRGRVKVLKPIPKEPARLVG